MTANGRYLGIKERDGKFILPYRLFINCAPGALYYCWQFEFIFVKLEISTQGNFQDYTNPMRFMQGFNFKIEAGKSEANEDPKAEQEAQTERMFKNTFRNFHDKSVEPAMFNANTIDFNYSLGEFYNRLTNPVFFYRCEIIEESWEVEPKNRDYENEVIQAEEEITETREEIRETLLTADMTNADYSIQDYIGSQDANI
ncbi:3964_t:CDS:2 [Entrophospora sp. SA101]|nr:3964_t:CDS:2 [Entrophospora sp. SA101]